MADELTVVRLLKALLATVGILSAHRSANPENGPEGADPMSQPLSGIQPATSQTKYAAVEIARGPRRFA
jgi:hypothetical protein